MRSFTTHSLSVSADSAIQRCKVIPPTRQNRTTNDKLYYEEHRFNLHHLAWQTWLLTYQPPLAFYPLNNWAEYNK